MRKLLLLSFVMVLGLLQQAYAQSRTVSGKVTDQGTSQGLPGVAVIVKGTNVGTTTGLDGTYSINVPENGKTLVFRFIGYQVIEREIGNAGAINVALPVDTKTLEEVVVVGYGTQQKKDVTSSIAQVKGSEIANLASPSFDQQLAGRAAGVQIQQSSGLLGAPPAIRVRGVNSITGSTSPLIVVDGVPVFSGNLGGFTSANALGDINPNDIESFEILKDGAATAIYGSRASNGVILITTKQGKKGQTKFNYDMYTGWAQAAELHDLLNAEQFVEIQNEKYKNAGATTLPAAMDANNTNTDWNDYVYRTGFQQSHTLAASGGSDKNSYYVSMGYSNQEGIARSNSLERFTLRANLDQKVTDWVKFGVQAGLSRQKNEGPLAGSNSLSGNTFAVTRMLPNVAVYDPNDPTGYNIDDTDPRALGRGANTITIANGIPNVRFVLDNNTRRALNYRLMGNTYLDFTLMKDLHFKTLLGTDITLIDDFNFNDSRHGDGYTSGGTMSQAYSTLSRWNWQNILGYNKTFADAHNLDVTLVGEYTKTSSSFYQASGTGISDLLFNENIISGTWGNQTIGGGLTENGLASYLGRVTYNYKSKYYLNASFRADGLSTLSPDNRWGYFKGAGVAWRISEEDFFKNSAIADVLSDLRIRGSYGEVGNSAISGGSYPYLGSYSSAQYGNQSGIGFNNTGNPDLSWEKQKVSDVGIDFSLFGGRIAVEVAYWNKDNNDVVLEAPTMPSAGLPGNKINMNIGRIVNNGLDLNLTATVIDKADFTWSSNLNFTSQRNEVKALVNGQDIFFNTYTIARVGESINSIYGYNFVGVNNANGNPIYSKADGTLVQGNPSNSTYYVYDPANPGALTTKSTLTSADKSVLGSALPKWFGGFDNNLRFKNFDVNVFVRYSGGNKVMNRTRQDLLTQNFENNSTEILNRWQSPENPGDGSTPILYAGRGTFLNTEGESSTRFVEKGDFIKLSNITLGYTLPKSLVGKLNVERMRVYAQLQNALTITDYSGLDPEGYTGLGYDYNTNPQQRVFTVGLNLGL